MGRAAVMIQRLLHDPLACEAKVLKGWVSEFAGLFCPGSWSTILTAPLAVRLQHHFQTSQGKPIDCPVSPQDSPAMVGDALATSHGLGDESRGLKLEGRELKLRNKTPLVRLAPPAIKEAMGPF